MTVEMLNFEFFDLRDFYNNNNNNNATLRSFSRTSIADASLLGVSLFPGVVLDEAWAAACSELSRAVED